MAYIIRSIYIVFTVSISSFTKSNCRDFIAHYYEWS